ncbi:MAG: 30S ribosomal protein S19 [Thermoplasmatota archaeon]
MVDPEDNEVPSPAAGAAPKRTVSRRARKKKAVVEQGRRKEFNYRGRPMEELLALPQDELVKILPSRARRFMRRGLDEDSQHFLGKMREAAEGEEVKTHLRDFPILPLFVGKTVLIHSGKEWHRLTIAPDMIGHKLGEFALTRKAVKHTGPGVGATRSSKFMPLK